MNREDLIFASFVVSSIMLEKEFLEFLCIVDTLFAQIVSQNFIMKIVLDVQSAESWSNSLKVQKDYHLILISYTRWLKKMHNLVNVTLILMRKMKNQWLVSFALNIRKGSNIFIVQIIKLYSAENALSCITLMTIVLW